MPLEGGHYEVLPAVANLHLGSSRCPAASRSHNPRHVPFHLSQHNLQNSRVKCQHTFLHQAGTPIYKDLCVRMMTHTAYPCPTRVHVATRDADSLFSKGLDQARCGFISVPEPEPSAALCMAQPAIAATAPTEDLPGR